MLPSAIRMLKSVDSQCRLTRVSIFWCCQSDQNVKFCQNSVYAESMVLPAIQMLKSVDIQCRLTRVSAVTRDPNVKICRNSAYVSGVVGDLNVKIC